MIHGAAEVGAEVAFIATRVPPALEPEAPAPVVRADAVSTMDSSSGSERQSSISIGSAASVAGNLLSGVFKKLTPAEKEAERKLEEAPSEDAAAAWAAAAGGSGGRRGGCRARRRAQHAGHRGGGVVSTDHGRRAEERRHGRRQRRDEDDGRDGQALRHVVGEEPGIAPDLTGSAPDAAGALAAAEALAAANPFTKLGGRK